MTVPEAVAHPIRILLLDDHALFRESVSRLLSAESDFDVVADCGTVEDGLQTLRRKSVDVLLLDFDLGEHDGREFLRLAKAQGFDGRVLIVTAGVDPGSASHLMRMGISGVFRKHDSAALLAQGIREVMAGKIWMSQDQLQSALRADTTQQAAATKRFTERERQVLSYVFDGLANKEIAGRLSVSEGSVKATLQQLFSKTGVRTRSQLVRAVLEQYKDQF